MQRITVQLKRPNPLFENWLEELKMTAIGTPAENTYAQALESLKKYPLVLNSGAECLILKGFSKTLCKILDRKLTKHNNSAGASNIVSPIKSSDDSQKSTSNTSDGEVFVPADRSGHKAMIAALYGKERMTKERLLIDAQIYCQKNLMTFKDNVLWSCMTLLTRNKFVTKSRQSNETYFALSDRGKEYGDKFIKNEINGNANRIDDDEIVCTGINLPNTGSTDCEVFYPDTFDVILLIDKQETSGEARQSEVTKKGLDNFQNTKYELCHLKVGDFLWIARHKTTKEELVLPYIVERKRMDDLGHSIKDGRFHEQKFRLKQCGLPNIIYLIENYGEKKHVGLPYSTLMQAVTNTRIQDNFITHYTESLADSMKFLAMMTKHITDSFSMKELRRCNREDVSSNQGAHVTSLMLFKEFNALSAKSKTLTVSDLFIKHLLQLKGVSIQKALAIVKRYETPFNLIKAYDRVNKEQGEAMLQCIEEGGTRHNIGINISKTIYKYYTSETLT